MTPNVDDFMAYESWRFFISMGFFVLMLPFIILKLWIDSKADDSGDEPEGKDDGKPITLNL